MGLREGADSGPIRRDSRPKETAVDFLWTVSFVSAAQAKAKNFQVFWCGWWYDREIVLLSQLVEIKEEYERDCQEALPS